MGKFNIPSPLTSYTIAKDLHLDVFTNFLWWNGRGEKQTELRITKVIVRLTGHTLIGIPLDQTFGRDWFLLGGMRMAII